MHLAEFILANIEAVACEWEEVAKTCTPAAIAMTRSDPLDDVAPILRAIADDMEQPQTPANQEAKGKSQRPGGPIGRAASTHVGLCIDSRFDLAQIVSEYRAMRASVLRLWASSHPEGLNQETMAVIRFDEAIDQRIAEIVPTYLRREAQYRDRFFGMFGHDLRTPLNAIHLSVMALVASRELSERGAKWVSRILNSSQRLDRMVRDALDFTRGRFGEPMLVNRVPADLLPILREIADELQCGNPDIVLVLAVTGDLRGEWDGERLSQLLSNLVMNAIQHGGANQVTIRAANDNDQVVIEVHNDGPPIPPDLLATIFDPLGRERRISHSQAGLGLGLFICQEIVKAHCGTISAASSPNTGTTFTVHLNGRAG